MQDQAGADEKAGPGRSNGRAERSGEPLQSGFAWTGPDGINYFHERISAWVPWGKRVESELATREAVD